MYTKMQESKQIACHNFSRGTGNVFVSLGLISKNVTHSTDCQNNILKKANTHFEAETILVGIYLFWMWPAICQPDVEDYKVLYSESAVLNHKVSVQV